MKALIKVFTLLLLIGALSGCLLKAPIDAAADVGSGAVHVATDVV
tara:strand:+ start:995 stop:1129 length:135 start_codon:yes stop_codon:yes gene_type:complete